MTLQDKNILYILKFLNENTKCNEDVYISDEDLYMEIKKYITIEGASSLTHFIVNNMVNNGWVNVQGGHSYKILEAGITRLNDLEQEINNEEIKSRIEEKTIGQIDATIEHYDFQFITTIILGILSLASVILAGIAAFKDSGQEIRSQNKILERHMPVLDSLLQKIEISDSDPNYSAQIDSLKTSILNLQKDVHRLDSLMN